MQVTQFALTHNEYCHISLYAMIDAADEHTTNLLSTKTHELIQAIKTATIDKSLITPEQWRCEITRLVEREWYKSIKPMLTRPRGKQYAKLTLEDNVIVFRQPAQLDDAIQTVRKNKRGEINIDEVLEFVLE